MASHYLKATTLLVLIAALLLLCLTAAAQTAPATDAPFPEVFSTAEATSTKAPHPTAEVEVDQHVGRIVAIFFSVFGAVWLVLSLCLAYYFICICPDRHTK